MNTQDFSSVKCMYFCKLSQTCFCRNTQVSQAFTNMISQALASCRANLEIFFYQCLASFRNLWFSKVQQGFARFTNGFQHLQKWIFARICKCENHDFPQGFAMGTLLMAVVAAAPLKPAQAVPVCLWCLTSSALARLSSNPSPYIDSATVAACHCSGILPCR